MGMYNKDIIIIIKILIARIARINLSRMKYLFNSSAILFIMVKVRTFNKYFLDNYLRTLFCKVCICSNSLV